MSKREKKILAVTAAVLCVLLVVLGILAVVYRSKKPAETPVIIAPFSAPAFDANAQSGEPENVDEPSFQALQMANFTFKICGEPTAEGSSAVLWLTNLPDNSAWMRAELYDESGNVLGSSGIVKIGEYVRSIATNAPLSAGQKVAVKVYCYEPETYYSMGTFTLQLVCK